MILAPVFDCFLIGGVYLVGGLLGIGVLVLIFRFLDRFGGVI